MGTTVLVLVIAVVAVLAVVMLTRNRAGAATSTPEMNSDTAGASRTDGPNYQLAGDIGSSTSTGDSVNEEYVADNNALSTSANVGASYNLGGELIGGPPSNPATRADLDSDRPRAEERSVGE